MREYHGKDAEAGESRAYSGGGGVHDVTGGGAGVKAGGLDTTTRAHKAVR